MVLSADSHVFVQVPVMFFQLPAGASHVVLPVASRCQSCFLSGASHVFVVLLTGASHLFYHVLTGASRCQKQVPAGAQK